MRTPAIDASVRLLCWMSRNSPAEWPARGSLVDDVHTRTIRASSRNGSGRSSTPLTTLKMAVLAAIPSAIVAIAIVVKEGDFSRARKSVAHKQC